MTRVGAVVVAYGEEPLLREAVEAVLASTGVEVSVALVDNGCTNPELVKLQSLPGVEAVGDGTNRGFTGGCNRGAAAVGGDVIVFVNSDAIVDPGALAALAQELSDDQVGLVCGKVVLHGSPEIVNTVGNPVHYTLLSWAGGWGDPASAHDVAGDVASATGCLFGARRGVWQELGGFHEDLFAYGEDVELSLRTWLSGRTVRYVPAARARHAYAFSRNPAKYYLLERNRWMNLLTVYEGRTLLVLAPALILLEAGTAVAAVSGGWLPQKAKAWGWLARNAGQVRARRRVVQSTRRRGDDALAPVLSARIEPAEEAGASVPGLVNGVFAAYWRAVSHSIGRPGDRRQTAPRSRSTARTFSAA